MNKTIFGIKESTFDEVKKLMEEKLKKNKKVEGRYYTPFKSTNSDKINAELIRQYILDNSFLARLLLNDKKNSTN